MDEKTLLFAILRTEICGEDLRETIKASVSEQMLEPLLTLAKKHDMAHIVGHCLGKLGLLGRDACSQELKKQTMMALYRDSAREKTFATVCDALEEYGIDHIPLKGSVLSKYYTASWMRTSCDIDILLKEETVDSAMAVLFEKGYQFESKDSHECSVVSPESVHVELHYALIEDTVSQKQADVLRNVWDQALLAEGTRHQYLLPDALFYFYHLAHMARHVTSGGCGIKPFLDIWILDNHVEHDRQQRDTLLEQGGLMPFSQAMHKLLRVWLGDGAYDAPTKQVECYILDGGTYGSLEQVIAVKQLRQGSKLKFALSRIFLNYDEMKYQYLILEKKPWLTPVYQVRRWCRLLFCGGAKRSAYLLKVNAQRTQEDISSTEAFLQYLGL